VLSYLDFPEQHRSKLHSTDEIDKSFSAGSRPPTGESSPRVGEVVQRGEAEIGIQPISELIEVAGIDVVGPLPADLQSPDLVYVAGSPATSEQPLPAKALIDFLAAPSASPVYKANGMEPDTRPTTSG
jgi:ABC-type molybdate transport system substrate-binding protein